jgi:hypothetical protein
MKQETIDKIQKALFLGAEMIVFLILWVASL